MRESFHVREASAVGAQLLLTDLDVALTFLDVADTSREPATVRRNRANALHAYDTVVGFLSKLTLTDTERQAIDAKLTVVRDRLSSGRPGRSS